MDEDSKREFDALERMRDHAWCEFQDKARIEWRLSFAIWGGLLASTGAILSADGLNRPVWLLPLSVTTVIAVAITHARFLLWVQDRLALAREFLREAQDKMQDAVGLTTRAPGVRVTGWKQPSLQVQLAITLLLGSLLALVVFILPAA